MTDDLSLDAQPFDAAEALQKLQRGLRDLGLTERAGYFERRGIAIARAGIDGMTVLAARVKRPSRGSPEWIERVLRSSADARDFVADLKKQLAQWSDRDD
ncbi:MAG: hypothetical protein EBY28_01115 [Betaproteobacteria bacterium]|nr:hypothetical protein [Betaproteobacteria bacterium]